jgi:hypothetical protein
MRVWIIIIVYSKLAKITIFLMCGAERADDLTDKDIPQLY